MVLFCEIEKFPKQMTLIYQGSGHLCAPQCILNFLSNCRIFPYMTGYVFLKITGKL